MSLPITWTSAGQNWRNRSSSRPVADRRDVVEQRVEPDVDRLGRVERDLDSPGKALSGDGHVLELGLDQVDDLVAPAFGLDEFRMRRVMVEQISVIRGQPEVVIFLLEPGQRRVGVVRTPPLTFFDLFLGLERLAAVAIVARVDAFVDVARVVDGLDELLAAPVMAFFAGLDEVVVARCRGRRQTSWNWRGHVVDVVFRLDSQLASLLGHLDGVLVVAHQEVDRVAFHAAKPSLHVGPDFFEGRADMRAAVGIVDRRRNEISRWAVRHPGPRLAGYRAILLSGKPFRSLRAQNRTTRAAVGSPGRGPPYFSTRVAGGTRASRECALSLSQ